MLDFMDFRPAQICDLPELSHLVEQLGYSSTSIKDLFDLYSGNQSMGLWVAAEKEQVVGCLAFSVLNQFHGGLLFRIVSLIVDASYRRKGVGRFLMDHAEREAGERGCVAIELTSALHRKKDGSHAFYRSLGYLDSDECGKCYFRKALG